MKPTNTKRPRYLARDEEPTPTVEDIVEFIRAALVRLPAVESIRLFQELASIVEDIGANGSPEDVESSDETALSGPALVNDYDSLNMAPRAARANAYDAAPHGVPAFDSMFPGAAKIKSNPGPRRKQPAAVVSPPGTPSLAEMFPTVARIRRS